MRGVATLAALMMTHIAVPASGQQTTPAPSAIRKGPKGVTGVSPLWEQIGKGDSAAAARDVDTAIAAYRAAIALAPEHPLGHYRLGQALALKGDLAEADAAYGAALRFAVTDAAMRAKILFCLADLRERQKSTDEAVGRWNEYSALAKSEPNAKAFPASADERRKRNEEWKKLSADSAEVKLRSEKRLKEADAAARKSAR